jgi:ferric-dicitrate binding protein FerR (iron transport regulator)
MNIKKLERWLYLEQSGELSARRLRRLERGLQACAEARQMRKDLSRMHRAVGEADVTVSAQTVSQIDARLRAGDRTTAGAFPGWKPVLALAACLAVALGLWNFHGGREVSSPFFPVIASAEVDVWSDSLEEELTRLENLIASLSGDPLDIMEM